MNTIEMLLDAYKQVLNDREFVFSEVMEITKMSASDGAIAQKHYHEHFQKQSNSLLINIRLLINRYAERGGLVGMTLYSVHHMLFFADYRDGVHTIVRADSGKMVSYHVPVNAFVVRITSLNDLFIDISSAYFNVALPYRNPFN
jgi:hypothetical protein